MNQTVSFGERLREVRLKLGLNQSDFGAIAGVTKKTQMLYESGERAPDSVYLAAIASAGADVLYVLTGVDGETQKAREQGAKGAALARAKLRQEIANERLTPRQRALLNNYEHTDEAGKKIIEAAASAAAQPTGQNRRAG